jgi:hypothetical protein
MSKILEAAMQSVMTTKRAAFRTCVLALAAALGGACASQNSQAPPAWDGLELVKNKDKTQGMDLVYVKPGASLVRYRRVMVDPVQISFDKNWKRDMDDDLMRFNKVDPESIRKELVEEFAEVSRRELEQEGRYELVNQPGDDVLRVTPAIINLYINAPDTMEPGRGRTFVMDAGQMTLIAELRDSMTNTLLARVVDREEGTDLVGLQVANTVTNSADAERAIAKWADALRSALTNAQTRVATAPSPSSPTS